MCLPARRKPFTIRRRTYDHGKDRQSYLKLGKRVDQWIFKGMNFTPCKKPTVFWRITRDIKLLLEFWPYGLKQAAANWIDVIAALKGKDMVIRQFSSTGLISFLSDWISESPDW
jgi:hypothetical protein